MNTADSESIDDRLSPAALRSRFLATVDLLHRRRARDIGDGLIDAYLAQRWLAWHGGALRVTAAGDDICRQLARQMELKMSGAELPPGESPARAVPRPGKLRIDERAELWRQGAKAAARGEADTANPMLEHKNGTASTGESQARWDERSGAWQAGHDLESAKGGGGT